MCSALLAALKYTSVNFPTAPGDETIIVPILQVRKLRPGPVPMATGLAGGRAKIQTRQPHSRFPSLNRNFTLLRFNFSVELLGGHSDAKNNPKRVAFWQTGH